MNLIMSNHTANCSVHADSRSNHSCNTLILSYQRVSVIVSFLRSLSILGGLDVTLATTIFSTVNLLVLHFHLV